ncbi:unnamed protein product [Dimorphilus gyrociliatus]|uniref:Cadherin domain-containing protein n=1 Tax=Dimorphilus gyrociliatus TaxID=2664684 RepID=A0A7I8VL18_9ANNE|nr:unnamed protein product [Dimorphilus gyrociliatus]
MNRLALLLFLAVRTFCEQVDVPHTAGYGYEVIRYPFSWSEEFYIHDSDIGRRVDISPDGIVRIIEDISHLKGESFKVIIRKSLNGRNWFKELHITVKDARYMLVFPQTVYAGHIYENEPRNSLVANLENVCASYRNQNDGIKYELLKKDSHSFFLHRENGCVSIKTTKSLDREQKKLYNFQIFAYLDEEGLEASSDIIVAVDDVEDNEPVFEKSDYYRTIPKNLPIKSEIITVRAKDADDVKIYYSLRPQHSLFEIDSYTGTVRLAQKGLTKNEEYLLSVHASTDTGRSSSTSYIHLKVANEKRDRSRSKRGTRERKTKVISETHVGEVIDLRPTNAELEQYQFVEPIPKEFSIDPMTGKISVEIDKRTKKSYLDYETKKAINFTVKISQRGVPSSK